jgi:hypothetical protein
MPVSIAGPKTGVRRRRMTVRYLSLPVISTLGFGAGARVWAIGALLLLPLYFFYVVHFTIAGAPGTGFLQYDPAYTWRSRGRISPTAVFPRSMACRSARIRRRRAFIFSR